MLEEGNDGVPLEEEMRILTGELKVQFEESHHWEEVIRKNLAALGCEV